MKKWELKYRRLKARHDDLQEAFADAMKYMVEFAEGMHRHLERIEVLLEEEKKTEPERR